MEEMIEQGKGTELPVPSLRVPLSLHLHRFTNSEALWTPSFEASGGFITQARLIKSLAIGD